MISCVVTQAPAITVSERLRNSAHTVEGGGSRYSLTPVSETALSQNANSNANTTRGAARFLSHVPRLERRAGADVSMQGSRQVGAYASARVSVRGVAVQPMLTRRARRARLPATSLARSEERRVGKECRSRW